jgi:hypothetical protein
MVEMCNLRGRPNSGCCFELPANGGNFSEGQLTQRPSIIPLGNPFSQPLGEVQGRAERLSGSAVAQPESNTAASKSKPMVGFKYF